MADDNLPLDDLPVDLPEDWKLNQAVSPSGMDAGLSKQHGYNYLMQVVNAGHRKTNSLLRYLKKKISEIENTFSNHKSDIVSHVTQADKNSWNDKYTKKEVDAKDKGISDTLSSHKSDTVAHVTQANKDRWNNTYIKSEAYTRAETDAKVKTVNDALTSHKNDTVSHVTQANKNIWNDKYTKNEVDNKLSALETKIDWKEAVATFADIAKTYPNPQDGWTVNTKDTDYTYRWTGSAWVAISANSIPKATQSVDGLLAKEDKKKLDDNTNARHTHTNKSILDKVTQVIIDNVMYFTDEEVTE